ncbi:MAG TPA: DUF4845 domain-containing protein [Burkholderiales bacterium]|jgi:hypothetical protein|nr:DUF4845 domain-containing protein [Burkholderiales bacterium]
MKRRGEKYQGGVTFIGMVFIAGLIVFGAIIGIKLVPAYIEYATVLNHVREIARSPEAKSGNVAAVHSAFMKRAQVDDIRSVSPEDVDVTKEGEVTVAYSTKIKLFGNLSACIDFVATSTGQ